MPSSHGFSRQNARLARAAWLVFSLAAAACVRSSGDANSGETHFLRSCDDRCAGGLSCVCGVCTSECTESSACEELSSQASCVEAGKGTCPTASVCEVLCAKDADCLSLSAAHRCRAGVCRAPRQSGSPDDASAADASASPGDAGARDAGARDAGARDASPGDAGASDAGSTDAEPAQRDAGSGTACGPNVCPAEQRCCDHCLGSCVAEAAELLCPDDRTPDRSCSDAGLANACGAVTCAADQRCCDHCTSTCINALSGANCPDDNEPGRSCDDAAVAQCASNQQSCLVSACCAGLICCGGIPIPAGEARCYASDCPDSDRNLKTGFATIDHEAVLKRVLALPISSWRYKDEAATISHIGPMAQDFKASFGVGADDKHIFPLDEGGVSLAAIQALHQQLTLLARSQQSLREENARMHEELARMREELRRR